MAAPAAKALTTAFYGKPAAHAYFEGCSNGGRQAMMMPQRYPDLFGVKITLSGATPGETKLSEASVIYRKEFFDLQWQFATRVAVLARMPLADALLDYTNFYARFGLGRGFDQAHPTWREYLHGLQRSAEPREWTYEFYRSLLPDRGAPDIVANVGCFSYARLADGNIRLHFHNAEMAGISPLSAERQPRRRDELRQLFESVRRDEGETVRVIGRSWLYHLDAYRRIFPITYLATATPSAPSFRGMPLWGQFLDRQGSIRRQTADLLLRRLSTRTSTFALGECFPYQVLALDGIASFFM